LAESPTFEWDDNKNRLNQEKHNVSFEVAQHAFLDTNRVIARDLKHSDNEERYYCFSRIEENVLTVRFVYRDHKIRIIGAGYWEKGKQIYEKENRI
jgi:hypothetical protein